MESSFVCNPSNRLGATLFPLPAEESKPKVVCLKCDLRTLWEVEDISFSRVHLLASLV
jgi:hypothetical protein